MIKSRVCDQNSNLCAIVIYCFLADLFGQEWPKEAKAEVARRTRVDWVEWLSSPSLQFESARGAVASVFAIYKAKYSKQHVEKLRNFALNWHWSNQFKRHMLLFDPQSMVEAVFPQSASGLKCTIPPLGADVMSLCIGIIKRTGNSCRYSIISSRY